LVVLNSTPLIYLAKIGKLEKLIERFKTITIAESVFAEVVEKGGKLSRPESVLLRKLVDGKKIIVKKVETFERAETIIKGIHDGEAQSLALARSSGDILVVDDKAAYNYATILGVKCLHSIRVMFMMLREGVISLSDFKENLRKLSSSGFWLTTDIYDRVMVEAERISKEK